MQSLLSIHVKSLLAAFFVSNVVLNILHADSIMSIAVVKFEGDKDMDDLFHVRAKE